MWSSQNIQVKCLCNIDTYLNAPFRVDFFNMMESIWKWNDIEHVVIIALT